MYKWISTFPQPLPGLQCCFIFCWNQLKCVILASKENNRWWFQISQVRTAISWSNCNCFLLWGKHKYVWIVHHGVVSLESGYFWHHQLKIHLLYRQTVLSFCQGHSHKSECSVHALAVEESFVLTLWEINIFYWQLLHSNICASFVFLYSFIYHLAIKQSIPKKKKQTKKQKSCANQVPKNTQ